MSHVALPPELALPAHYRAVEDHLRALDADLRLRRSAEQTDLYVLERRVRRGKPIATTRELGVTDRVIQARDGYVHIATVHPWYLDRPDKLIAELKGEDGENDLATQSADAWWRRFCDREQAARVQRFQRRLDTYTGYVRESFDVLNRVGGIGGTERTRMQNTLGDYRWNLMPPTDPPAAPAGEIPATEVVHADTPGTPSGGASHQLHGQSCG